MRYLIILFVTFSFNIFSTDSKKLDPIIFMLDLSIVDSQNEEAKKFTYEITKKVKANEPDTIIYQYYFDSDNKVFLYEVYKGNDAAIMHVEDFRGSDWETRFGDLFVIDNFSVLGNSSEALKESLEGYPASFRAIEGGFSRPAESLGEEIFKL